MLLKLLILSLSQLLITSVVLGLEDSSTFNFIDSILTLETTNQNLSEKDFIKEEFQSKFQKLSSNSSFEVARNKTTTWLKLIINKNIDPKRHYILEINRPTFDFVSAYIPENDESWKIIVTGDNYQFSSREIDHENFTFNVSGSPSSPRKVATLN